MKTILLLGFIMLSFNASADRYSLSPPCYKPNKPLMYSPAYYIDRYNKDALEYEKCINDFIAEQERSIHFHKESIQQARALLKQQKATSDAALLSF